jgi:hypothetical protein
MDRFPPHSRLRSGVASWRYLLPRCDDELADCGAPGGFGLAHVFSDKDLWGFAGCIDLPVSLCKNAAALESLQGAQPDD